MMPSPFNSLVNPELQRFIVAHENDDEKLLVLKHKTILGIPSSIIAEQISGRRKSKTKLPSFYKTSNIVYPPVINLEQCSSEATALYKARFFNGERMADLTGGFGIDTFFFSKHFKQVDYIEQNDQLLENVRHNHLILGAANIQYHKTTAEHFLETTKQRFDLIYIDPSRRAKGNQKVFKLSDCEPDITRLLNTIFNKSNVLLIKTSPLLDLHQGLKELKSVEKILVVSVENECKEVLFLCKKGFAGEAAIEAVNIQPNSITNSFAFLFSEEQNAIAKFTNPLTFLYEPNASILKAGAFKSVALRFNLNKIHPSTHLYTSESLLEDFPGRIFTIEANIKPDLKSWKSFFPEGKANITTRNYPLSVEELKKKTGLKDGGEKYLIGFSGIDQKFLIVAARLKIDSPKDFSESD